MLWISFYRLFLCYSVEKKVVPISYKSTQTVEALINMEIHPMLQEIVDLDEHLACADCGAMDTEWASLGFGTLICLSCAGFHRSLGTHITSVRAVKLDTWSKEHINILKNGGNNAFRDYCETLDIPTQAISTIDKYSHPRVLFYRLDFYFCRSVTSLL
jgi:hypothetical protein